MMFNALRISNTSLTVMKIIGITVMVIDHFNSFVNPDYSQALFEIGRIAFPLFALVLGYNLARTSSDKMPKIMLRLLVFGIMATPVYNALSGGLQYWWPLNILFTLCLATTVVYLLSLPTHNPWSTSARLGAILLFVAVGGLVDYLWVGSALIVVIWRLFSGTSNYYERVMLHMVLLGLAGLLCMINEGLATLFALPVIYLATVTCQDFSLPRMKWFFYWFYPGHLTVLLLIKNTSY